MSGCATVLGQREGACGRKVMNGQVTRKVVRNVPSAETVTRATGVGMNSAFGGPSFMATRLPGR
jgi:hypothetical protein